MDFWWKIEHILQNGIYYSVLLYWSDYRRKQSSMPFGGFMFNTIEELAVDLAAGKMIVLTDDENRENEGDLIMAAEKVTPEAVNFMVTNARGLVCSPMTRERALELNLHEMTRNTDPLGTCFTVSVDANEGTTTGISAYDRAKTLASLADPRCMADAFHSPGHVFPLIARDGGVLVRAGHTEAAVDLMRVAGLLPNGVICEILNEDGTMARLPQLEVFCEKWGLKLGNVASLVPVPGGIGAYHYLLKVSLMGLYGTTEEIGLLFATLCHELHAVLVIVLGVWSYIFRIVILKNGNAPKVGASRKN